MRYHHQYAIRTHTFTCVFPYHLDADGLQRVLEGREGSLSQLLTFQYLALVPILIHLKLPVF